MEQPKINTRNWSAIEATDNIAGSNPHLDVAGEVETSRSNQRASLSVATPQGMHPKILLLHLEITSEGDIGNDVMGWTQATLRTPVEPGQYSSVQIVYEGSTVGSADVIRRPS